MFERVWIEPPLAIARVGGSPVPCGNFRWAANDLSPDGSGRTGLASAETLTVAADGSVSASLPAEVVFRDADGIRPVCPFFELWGAWREDDGTLREAAVTPALLERFGLALGGVRWRVELANRKAFHFTLDSACLVEATFELAGDDTAARPLEGRSPATGAPPLAAEGRPLPMGRVQLTRPSADFPELRLRFRPPVGATYGPEDLEARVAAIPVVNDAEGGDANGEWRGFAIPAERLILNPAAAWVGFSPELTGPPPIGPGDQRVNPQALFAMFTDNADGMLVSRGLGLVDDVGDGLVRCALPGGLEAVARIVVAPPDYAPDRRHVVSLADNLTDREDRAAAREDQPATEELAALMRDLLERAFETSDLMNKDAQNDRSTRTNRRAFDPATSPFTREQIEAMLWPVPDPRAQDGQRADPLTLSREGQRKHRRQSSIEVLEDRLREAPDLIDRWIRRPLDPNPFFDRRMPALMRGSDGRPFHLTRRQWELLRLWAGRLRAGAPPGT